MPLWSHVAEQLLVPQLRLGPPAAVYGRPADPGRGCDQVDGRRRIAALDEQPTRRGQHCRVDRRIPARPLSPMLPHRFHDCLPATSICRYSVSQQSSGHAEFEEVAMTTGLTKPLAGVGEDGRHVYTCPLCEAMCGLEIPLEGARGARSTGGGRRSAGTPPSGAAPSCWPR